MQAIVNAAQMIQLGEAKMVLAGGMEAMSQAPFTIRGRDGFNLAPGGKLEDSLMVALLDSYCGLVHGEHRRAVWFAAGHHARDAG